MKRVIFFATVLVATVSHADTLRQATTSEAKEATIQLSKILQANHEFADGMTATNARKTLYWSSGSSGRLLVPVLVRFPGQRIGYCRVGTLSTDLKEPTLIDIPENANAPDCKSFRDLHYLDVNGDGYLDIVASITIRSNTFDGYVDLPVVYLSHMQRPGGYCYSKMASEALEPATTFSIDTVRKALEHEKRRRNIQNLRCEDET